MRSQESGFSLIEMLIALLIVLCTGMMTFQLFNQNARVIRDQTLIMEMQQTARIVMSQIADEVRIAGQGTPVYASTYDIAPSEPIASFFASSGSNRIDFRAGLSNVETAITTVPPIDLTLGSSRTLGIADPTGLSAAKYIYIWGPSGNGWTWVHGQLISVTSTTITFIPQQTGAPGGIIHFTASPTVYLEEAVSITINSGSVRHATATGFANPASPTWAPANEIGANFTALTFTYYDVNGNVVTPALLPSRMSIARVDIHLTVQAAGPLSNGIVPTYSLALRTIPRNVRIRSAN